jgi:hypothetical protein
MDELLAIVGGSWQPLLLYPGILATLLATLLLRPVWRLGRSRPVPGVSRLSFEPISVFYLASTLLVCALLPFPRSYWAYPIDLIVVLLLLEAPHWARITRLSRAPQAGLRAGAALEAANLANVYVLLALAIALLGQASGSLVLTEVKNGAPLPRWIGLAAWSIALPPLLALGPWYVPETEDGLLAFRRVAHIALLVALALPAGDKWGHNATAIAAAIAFGSLVLLHLGWKGSPERWERLQPFIALALLLFLLYTNVAAWSARLR